MLQIITTKELLLFWEKKNPTIDFWHLYLHSELLQWRREQQASDLCDDWSVHPWNDNGLSLPQTAVNQDDVYGGSHAGQSFHLSPQTPSVKGDRAPVGADRHWRSPPWLGRAAHRSVLAGVPAWSAWGRPAARWGFPSRRRCGPKWGPATRTSAGPCSRKTRRRWDPEERQQERLKLLRRKDSTGRGVARRWRTPAEQTPLWWPWFSHQTHPWCSSSASSAWSPRLFPDSSSSRTIGQSECRTTEMSNNKAERRKLRVLSSWDHLVKGDDKGTLLLLQQVDGFQGLRLQTMHDVHHQDGDVTQGASSVPQVTAEKDR